MEGRLFFSKILQAGLGLAEICQNFIAALAAQIIEASLRPCDILARSSDRKFNVSARHFIINNSLGEIEPVYGKRLTLRSQAVQDFERALQPRDMNVQHAVLHVRIFDLVRSQAFCPFKLVDLSKIRQLSAFKRQALVSQRLGDISIG